MKILGIFGKLTKFRINLSQVPWKSQYLMRSLFSQFITLVNWNMFTNVSLDISNIFLGQFITLVNWNMFTNVSLDISNIFLGQLGGGGNYKHLMLSLKEVGSSWEINSPWFGDDLISELHTAVQGFAVTQPLILVLKFLVERDAPASKSHFYWPRKMPWIREQLSFTYNVMW